MVTVAAVQLNVTLKDLSANKKKIVDMDKNLDADLIVFPECSTSGYLFKDKAEAFQFAEALPGPLTLELAELSKDRNVCIALGVLERDDEVIYNSVLFFTPDGKIQKYRKTHTPHLGVDRFVKEGNTLILFDSPFGPIGVVICYEWRFPEIARSLALGGANLLIGLSNWPEGAEVTPDVLMKARAVENHIWIVSVNRVGNDGDINYIGRSSIISPKGEVLGSLDREEDILIASIDPEESKVKKIVKKKDDYELDLFKDRRPGLYSNILTEDTSA